MKEFNVDKFYILQDGKHYEISDIKEIETEVVEEEDEKIRTLSNEFTATFFATCDIDANSTFVREIQNHHKKYLRRQ